MTDAAPSAEPCDRVQTRYTPPTSARRPVLIGIGLTYLVLWWLVSSQREHPGQDGAVIIGRGHLQAFDLATPPLAPAKRLGQADGAARPAVTDRHPVAAPIGGDPRANVQLDSPGNGPALAAAISDVLGDDPAAEGDMLGYRQRLLDHLRRFTRYPVDTGVARPSGVVMIRFRIARDGTVIDSRIVSTHNALLDAAALNAVWQASPLPIVPHALSVPCEIDVPIAFGAPAPSQRRH